MRIPVTSRWTKDSKMNRLIYFVMLVLLYGSLGVRSHQVIMGGSPLPSNLIAINNMDSENKPTEKKDQKQYDAATLFDGLQVASIKYWISSCITGQFWINFKKNFDFDRNSLNPVAVLEERTGFTDLAKHMGNYAYRGVVRRVSYLCLPFFPPASTSSCLRQHKYGVSFSINISTGSSATGSHGTRGRSFFDCAIWLWLISYLEERPVHHVPYDI